MRRREFIAGLGVAAAWPGGARAQQSDQMRRIAYLTTKAENDPQTQQWVAAFRKGLEEHGWIEGRNVRIDFRFGGGDDSSMPRLAKELLERRPDVVLAATGPAVNAVESRCGAVALGRTYLLPPLSSGGALVVSP
jgi:ABC-type uncharacterized transport system substrate-binding protein